MSSFYPEPETTISFAPYLMNYSDRFTTFLYLIVWYGCLNIMIAWTVGCSKVLYIFAKVYRAFTMPSGEK
jgi:hypothetical protein